MDNDCTNEKLKNCNISLIGFMGSGKSTIGKILAERINYLFFDLDVIIEIYEGIKISEIFEKYGEKHFRDTESEIIGKIYCNRNCVFSCGGGVILREGNMKIIKGRSTVIYLSASPENIMERLKNSIDRPLLSTSNKIKKIIELMDTRNYLYGKYSDILIDTDGKNPSEITEMILDRLDYQH